MRNVLRPAASAAPIRSGTDDGVRTGRKVRASSKSGAATGGRVVEVVLDVSDVVVRRVSVVVGRTVSASSKVGVVTDGGRVVVGRTVGGAGKVVGGTGGGGGASSSAGRGWWSGRGGCASWSAGRGSLS